MVAEPDEVFQESKKTRKLDRKVTENEETPNVMTRKLTKKEDAIDALNRGRSLENKWGSSIFSEFLQIFVDFEISTGLCRISER